jgi:hypothetical protein
VKSASDHDGLLGPSAITAFVNEPTTSKVSRSKIYHWIESGRCQPGAWGQRSSARRSGSGNISSVSRGATEEDSPRRSPMSIRSAAIAVGFVDRPDWSRMRLLGFRPRRKGELLGFARLELPISDIPILAGPKGVFAALPVKPIPDGKGRQKREAVNGYLPCGRQVIKDTYSKRPYGPTSPASPAAYRWSIPKPGLAQRGVISRTGNPG